ncbi:MAG: multicopper oxidase family protein [bacterium]|nr:multicopper oxidase family protein [Candidatus Kapabacteria bacterium]
MKRRAFIRNGGLAIATAIASPLLSSRSHARSVGNPLRIPATLAGSSLEAKTVAAEVWPGSTTDLMTLGGTWPGPTIRVRRGDQFEVDVVNRLDESTTVHWHGLVVPPDMDGHPMDVIAPNASRRYSFEVLNRAGTYWYHPHPHERTAAQTYQGMAGIFIVEDDDEQNLDLPRGAYDVPLLIQDRIVRGGRTLVYDPDSIARLNGTLGDTVFVNGTPDAYLNVDRGLYRLRLINASNARILRLAFNDGRSFNVIGCDGGLLDRSHVVNETYLAPAERIEIVVDFAALAIGQSVELRSLAFGSATTYAQQGFELAVMSFVGTGGAGHSSISQTLIPHEPFRIDDARKTQSITLDTSPIPLGGHHHKINGVVFDMHRIDARIPLDELQLWEITNQHTMSHPIHIHGTQFQVVDRTTVAQLAPVDMGWKDTVLVAGKETVRVLIRFSPFVGTYLLHCHNLEHEDDGMMINFSVDQRTAVDDAQAIPTKLDLR